MSALLEETAGQSAFQQQATRYEPDVECPQRRPMDDGFKLASLRNILPQQYLFAEGTLKTHVYKVVTGAISTEKVWSDGRRQVVDFAFPGEHIGLDAAPIYALDARAISATRVLCLPHSIFRRRLDENEAFAQSVTATLSDELARARKHAMTIGRLHANGRVATFLLSLSSRARRLGLDPKTIRLAMRRSDVADYLCLSHETISRSLTEFKLAGTISIFGFRQIELIDCAALSAIANGDATSR